MTDTLSEIIIVVFLMSLTGLEIVLPYQILPRVRLWWPRVFFLQLSVFVIITFGVSSWQDKLLLAHLVDGQKYFSPLGGGIASYFVSSFIFYWWHRVRHSSQILWQIFHQTHHSPSRIQAFTAFYVHPLEAVISSLLNAAIVFILFGLSRESLIWNAFFTAGAGIFYHMNLRTPRWLGWFIQRPEMHRYHHEFNVHGRNYSDLPIWDILFGTYWNPQDFSGECGFGNNKELKFWQILSAQDVNKS